MFNRHYVNGGLMGTALMAAAVGFSGAAHADGAGWFIGGLVTSKVLTNMERRTQAQEAQAHYASRPQPVQRAAPAPSKPSAEEQMKQLDKLAAGGYITPEEYKARKKAILDAM